MDMIEVDPKLFVTCRLCLEDLGQYQIVPIVQQQIKYCYDIDVEPFDGLPQLICMKCKEVLGDFFTVKKHLCEKQSNLKSKILKKDKTPQQDTVSSSQQLTENIEETKPKQKKKRVIHSSDSENSCDVALQIPKKKKITNSSKTDTWNGAGFNRELICTICDVKWPHLKSLLNHRRTHLKLRTQYPTVFKKNCSVTLEKIDGKDNITGMNNIVVHNNSKIIENRNSFYYYVRYSKDKQDVLGDSSLETASEKYFPKNVDPESTDTEQEVMIRPQRRKRRIISRSSNETVVIESNGNKAISDNEDSQSTQQNEALVAQTTNIQCINIEDSSDTDTEKNDVESRLRPALEAKLGDYKTIQGIITMCVNAHHRKYPVTEKSDRQAISESQLKCKILGIGRKVINRPGFNWTGLSRYVEYEHLEMMWLIKFIDNSKDVNYIRIISNLRGNSTADDEQGWIPKPETVPIETPVTSLSTAVALSAENKLNGLQTNNDTAVIFLCNSSDPKNKLLNANPVANPKQLPRKLAPATEFRANSNVTEPCAPSFHSSETTEVCWPIITSTTSLAAPNVIAHQDDNNTTLVAVTNPETPVPRIKVKPDSELMSERILNSLREQSATVSTSNMLQNQNDQSNSGLSQVDKNNLVLNQNVPMFLNVPKSMPNIFTPHIVSPQIATANQPMQLVQIACVNPISVPPTLTYQNIALTSAPTTSLNTNNKNDFVLLNTVELPNTKSCSPYKYLRHLLSIHNIILVDPKGPISQDFVCLIKFKVQFRQEPINQPVVLCLSLFRSKNKFCFMVKDRNYKDLNMSKISPNWQWEIIKVFQGNVIDKLLQNAEQHSQEALEYTNKFMCVIKSINNQDVS